MIVVLGRPRLDALGGLARLAGRIAAAAATNGARVELVGSVTDDDAGDAAITALGKAGIGHAALLRMPTSAGQPRLDAADIELGLRYVSDCRVLVIADALDAAALAAAVDGAQYHGAHWSSSRQPCLITRQFSRSRPTAAPDAADPAPPCLITRQFSLRRRTTARSRIWWVATPRSSTPAVRGGRVACCGRRDRLAGDGRHRRRHRAVTQPEPIVVYGDAYLDYDFGPDHPLTPRRFAPSVALMRASGATRFVAPRDGHRCGTRAAAHRGYIRTVKNFSNDPWHHVPTAGIGPGDCPPFEDMHEASATVAGGSIEAVDRILGGESEHAFNPGGGLHHAMAARASGFCIYNDVALGVARARDAGHRVLYVDLDVHHGDGTQALFWDDPDVLTFSIHETGMTLFPGTGFVDETRRSAAPRARPSTSRSSRTAATVRGSRPSRRSCPRSRTRSGRRFSSPSTAATRTPTTRSRTCA